MKISRKAFIFLLIFMTGIFFYLLYIQKKRECLEITVDKTHNLVDLVREENRTIVILETEEGHLILKEYNDFNYVVKEIFVKIECD